jgi:Ras GTPase-activating-like protein IQGAP2/3
MAERIGNLLGHLKFSDDQLERTQKGLTAAGVAMPNFGNVGRELAKDLNEEPEPEPEPEETDEERAYPTCCLRTAPNCFYLGRDRELMECEDSIVGLQSMARAFLVRKSLATQRGRLRLAERYVPKLQAKCRAALARRSLNEQRKERLDLTPWAKGLQSAARGVLARRAWMAQLRRIKAIGTTMIKVQAQSRGVIQRRRFALLKGAIRKSIPSVVKLQTIARARVARNTHKEVAKSFGEPQIVYSVTALQAQCRGVLARWKDARLLGRLRSAEPYVAQLQAHARGVLMRRRVRNQLAKLDDVSDIVVRIQAAVRTYLARKRLLSLIRGLRRATPMLVGLQSLARARLAQREHKALSKALGEVKVVQAVGGLQALARAALARNKHKEQAKQLEFCAPDVTGFQAAARGALVRREWYAWRDHLWNSQAEAAMLQALLRGVLQRRKFRAKIQHYRANMDKVVKIQSLFRAKETREQYRQLTLGKNVNVGTIKNFVHLLDDSEADFQEELQVERLRKKVVENIRENQTLESEVNDLDVKIALVVQNVKNFEEVVKARRRHGGDNAAAHAARASLLAAHGDPFAGPSTLDHEARRKLELYQQLFYILQTRGEYLSRLFMQMSLGEVPEKNRRLTERVVLTLFGYAQDRREDYLLLKLFQVRWA